MTVASVILPGLGHLAIGKRRIGLAFLVPSVIVLVLALVWVASQGLYGVAAALVTPRSAASLRCKSNLTPELSPCRFPSS